jgi:hypothetical protein
MDLEAIAEQQDAPKEEAMVETVKTLVDCMGAGICRVLPTAKEMGTGQWWVSAEDGHCPKMVDLLCHFCTAHRTMDMVIGAQAGTLLYEEPRKDEYLG